MQRAPNGVSDNQAVDERTVIMRTVSLRRTIHRRRAPAPHHRRPPVQGAFHRLQLRRPRCPSPGPVLLSGSRHSCETSRASGAPQRSLRRSNEYPMMIGADPNLVSDDGLVMINHIGDSDRRDGRRIAAKPCDVLRVVVITGAIEALARNGPFSNVGNQRRRPRAIRLRRAPERRGHARR